MKRLAVDIFEFLKSLTAIDYVLYFAVLILIILVVSLLYLLKTTDIEDEEVIDSDKEEFDIKNTIEELSQSKPQNISLNQYEQEQEEKAIISYDELVKSIKRNGINYETEELIDNTISVKKVNLDNIIQEHEESKPSIKVISFAHEEEFLRALKQLQNELN